MVKKCTYCMTEKPLAAFSIARNRSGAVRPHSHCKTCRNERARQRLCMGLRKDRPKPGRMGETSPTAWIRPRDDRPIHEKLRDVQLRRWARCVEPGQLLGRVA
jgi:hypothetical protein